MTPSARKPVESKSAFHFPESVEVIESNVLAWSVASDHDELTFRGGDDVLSAFLDLASAEPDEMADFLTVYGIPELCQHGLPDRHPDNRRKGPYCAPDVLEDERPFIGVSALRLASRAFGAAVSAGLQLSTTTLPDPSVWKEMLRLSSGWRAWPEVDTRQRGRANLAVWLTDLLHDCGVAPVARWDGPRLYVTSEADGLLGTLAVLLSREIGQGDRYTCDVCGAPVNRVRPPKAGESVYCDKPACKREQQRRNQQRWRERKRATEQGQG